jgi:hypothetical protein
VRRIISEVGATAHLQNSICGVRRGLIRRRALTVDVCLKIRHFIFLIGARRLINRLVLFK